MAFPLKLGSFRQEGQYCLGGHVIQISNQSETTGWCIFHGHTLASL